MEEKQAEQFEGWAVVEVMGHSMYAGYAKTVSFGGDCFFRVDVPEIKDRWSNETIPAFTKFLSMKSIFGFTPCTEAVARKAAESKSARPMTIVDLSRPALPKPTDDEPIDDDFDGYDDDE